MLGWIAHLRYLNRLCSSDFLQSIMLSRYRQWLAMDALQPTVQQLMKYFAQHTEIPTAGEARDPEKRRRSMSVLRCCQFGKGDEVDLAVSFVTLLRAFRKRARLVKSFQLRLELMDMMKQIGGDASDPKTQSMIGELGIGLSVSLAAEKASLPEAEYANSLAYACLQKPGGAPMETWVEFFDEFSGDWCAVDPGACVICPTLSDHWLHLHEGYIIAIDDALKGKDYFYLTDLTERYRFHLRDMDKDQLSKAEQDTVRRKAWWKQYLEAHTELENDALDLKPRCPQDCELVLQVEPRGRKVHPLQSRRAPKRQAKKRVQRKRGISDGPEPLESAPMDSELAEPMEDCLEAKSEVSLSPEPLAELPVPKKKKKIRKVATSKVRRRGKKGRLRARLYQNRGISGFPSVEPFEENARQLQRHLATTGLAPWGFSQNSQERDLAAFVENVKKLRALGRLKSHVQKKLMDWCPLWKKLEVGEATVVTKEVLQMAGPVLVEQNSQKSRNGCMDLQSVRAALQLSRCQDPAERRNLLRKLQVSFHPDKNRDQEEASREMFEVVQKMWEKEFK